MIKIQITTVEEAKKFYPTKMTSTEPTTATIRRGTKHNQAKWDDDKTKKLLDVFIEEITAGNRPTSIFSKQGWKNVVEKFNAKTGLSLNKYQLMNKQDNLKKEFTKWESLIGKETGLGWDHARRTLVAPDNWWFDKAKADPTILRYKDAGPPFLDLLQRIFGGITANGYRAYIPEESNPLLAESGHLEDIANEVEDNQSNWEEGGQAESESESDPGVGDGETTNAASKLPARKRKRKTNKVSKISQTDKIVSSMDSMSQSTRESVNYLTSRRRPDTDFGMGYVEALDLLRNILGMEPEMAIYFKGVRVLEDKTRRLAFGHILQDGKNAVLAWLSTFPDYF